MLNKEIVAKINKQINFEFYSAYVYLDISNYYADRNLDGFANWFKIQTQEERDHAMLFMDYLLQNGEKIALVKVPLERHVVKARADDRDWHRDEREVQRRLGRHAQALFAPGREQYA